MGEDQYIIQAFASSYERKRIAGVKKPNAFKDGLLILISMILLFIKR